MRDLDVFRLPDVGEGLTEADIVTWHVKVGDTVAINDNLLDVETAKSVVELPSPYAGVVVELHAVEGDTVPVGQPLITIGTAELHPGRTPAPEAPEPATAEPPPVEPHPEPAPEPRSVEEPEAPLILVGTGPKEAVARRVHLRRPDEDTYDRRSQVSGSPKPTLEDGAAERRIPVKGVRKVTAETMIRSAFTAPHATMWATEDVTAAIELVELLKHDPEWKGVRVTPLLVVARAVALAVRAFPDINASWDDDAQEIVVRRDLNLGVAAATPRGLMVPNVKDAGSMSLRELALALDDVVQRARAGALTPSDLSGGTLTLTNVGTFGVEGATPILNPPEAAILALGAIQRRPWGVDGAVVLRDVMTISISIDHRLVDGELGAKVLRHVSRLLTNPGLAML